MRPIIFHIENHVKICQTKSKSVDPEDHLLFLIAHLNRYLFSHRAIRLRIAQTLTEAGYETTFNGDPIFDGELSWSIKTPVGPIESRQVFVSIDRLKQALEQLETLAERGTLRFSVEGYLADIIGVDYPVRDLLKVTVHTASTTLLKGNRYFDKLPGFPYVLTPVAYYKNKPWVGGVIHTQAGRLLYGHRPIDFDEALALSSGGLPLFS